MNYALRFEYIGIWYWIIPLFLLTCIAKKFFATHAFYQYTLAHILASSGSAATPIHKKVFNTIRIICLMLLGFLIAKPQLVDTRSTITVDGIDIMLALDVSGSMQYKDYDDDQRSRIEVAKDEALHFINKRTHDALGLVIFGNDAVSRIPLTTDKQSITALIRSLQLGIIDPEGTVLSTALVTAANRLKTSRAKSKVIILLTDGTPSEADMDPAVAITMAQKMGIKIYTIGIGSDEDQFIMHPFFGMIPKPKVNKSLLTKIAHETGGKFFLARSSKDMRTIYDTIDSLEKTTYESPLYSNYYDIFIPVVWGIIILLFVELGLSATVWFGI